MGRDHATESTDLIQFTLGAADDPATTETDETKNTEFSIGNEPGAELPHTGGPGTRLIYLAGVLITVLAAIGFALNRQRNSL